MIHIIIMVFSLYVNHTFHHNMNHIDCLTHVNHTCICDSHKFKRLTFINTGVIILRNFGCMYSAFQDGCNSALCNRETHSHTLIPDRHFKKFSLTNLVLAIALMM